jgi:hypothetical protein
VITSPEEFVHSMWTRHLVKRHTPNPKSSKSE